MQRREFIKSASLGLASLPFYTFGSNKVEQVFDVVIVGAGLSGLVAAKRLMQANKRILVLEAQDRVGGRTWSQPLTEGDFIDVGGQWIGNGHERMYQLVSEAGLKTFPTYTKGKSILRINSENRVYQRDIPSMGVVALLATQRGINRFDKAASELSLEAPWKSPRATEWDNLSIGNWIDKNVPNPEARLLITRMAEGELCQPLDRISALQVFAAANSTGSFKQAEKVDGGALQDRIVGGAQAVSNFLYQQLQASVRLNCPVNFVNHMQEYVELGNEEVSFRAKKIILTVPLPVTKHIRFTPELPAEKQVLINSMEYGSVIKSHTVYPTPFWRTNGFNGSSMCLDVGIDVTVDNSIPGSSKGILTALIHADRARYLLELSTEERKLVLLKHYSNLFGDQALTPLYHHDYSFTNNPWIGGAYSGFFAMGIYSRYGDFIAKPSGNIHWAGTETSTKFRGFMEGAVLSGERVANEILELTL